MEPQTLVELAEAVRDGGSTALLVAAIVGGFKGWFVWRWQYEEVKTRCQTELEKAERDRDHWRQVALDGLNLAERVTG